MLKHPGCCLWMPLPHVFCSLIRAASTVTPPAADRLLLDSGADTSVAGVDAAAILDMLPGHGRNVRGVGPQTIRRCNKLLSPPAAIGEGDEQRQLAARAKRRSAGFRTAVYLLNTITYGDLSGFHMAVFGRTISEGCAIATNRTQ